MPYNDKELKRAAGQQPAPQYFDPTLDDYRVLEGDADGPQMQVKAIGKQTDAEAGPDLSQAQSGIGLWKGMLAALRSIVTALAGVLGVQLASPLPAGNNNIGDVDVASMPAVTQGAPGAQPWPVSLSQSNVGIDGEKTVAVAGTAETLVAESTPCREVIIQAKSTNTKTVKVGRTNAPKLELSPLASITLAVSDAHTIYVDALANGEGVNYTINQ